MNSSGKVERRSEVIDAAVHIVGVREAPAVFLAADANDADGARESLIKVVGLACFRGLAQSIR